MHDASLYPAVLRLAAARAVCEEGGGGGDHGGSATASVLGGWDPAQLAPDAAPPSPLAQPCALPRAYALHVARAGAELSAARWPGALRKLGELAEATAVAPGGSRLGWEGAASCAERLRDLLARFSAGDSAKEFDILPLLAGPLSSPHAPPSSLEAALHGEYVRGALHRELARGDFGRDDRGNLCSTPVLKPPPRALLCVEAIEAYMGAGRRGGMHVLGGSSEGGGTQSLQGIL